LNRPTRALDLGVGLSSALVASATRNNGDIKMYYNDGATAHVRGGGRGGSRRGTRATSYGQTVVHPFNATEKQTLECVLFLHAHASKIT
jgi:hypothetical protein